MIHTQYNYLSWVGNVLWSFPGAIRGQGEMEERGGPLQMGRWQVEQGREGTYKAFLGQPQDKPATILKVCVEALTRFRHVYCPDSLNTTSLS